MKYILVLLATLLIAPLSAQSLEYAWKDAKGDAVSLESMKGEPVILHFWASWCPPCRTEMPVMSAWVKAHPDVKVVMISLDYDQDGAEHFYMKKGIELPLNMANMRETSRLGVRGLPTTIIIDADGEITKRHIGDIDWADEKVSQQILSWL